MQGGGAGPQPEPPRSPPPRLGPGAAPEGLAWVPQETGLRGWWLHGGWRDRLMPAALQEDALGARLGLPGTRISTQSPSQFRRTLDSGTGHRASGTQHPLSGCPLPPVFPQHQALQPR